jgi:hypothetical protein
LAAVKSGTISINTAATVASLPAGCLAGGATAVARKSCSWQPGRRGKQPLHRTRWFPIRLKHRAGDRPPEVHHRFDGAEGSAGSGKAWAQRALKPGCGHAVIKFTPRVDELLPGRRSNHHAYEFFLLTPLLFAFCLIKQHQASRAHIVPLAVRRMAAAMQALIDNNSAALARSSPTLACGPRLTEIADMFVLKAAAQPHAEVSVRLDEVHAASARRCTAVARFVQRQPLVVVEPLNYR